MSPITRVLRYSAQTCGIHWCSWLLVRPSYLDFQVSHPVHPEWYSGFLSQGSWKNHHTPKFCHNLPWGVFCGCKVMKWWKCLHNCAWMKHHWKCQQCHLCLCLCFPQNNNTLCPIEMHNPRATPHITRKPGRGDGLVADNPTMKQANAGLQVTCGKSQILSGLTWQFSKSTNINYSCLFFPDIFSYNCLTIKIASIVLLPDMKLNCISCI